MADYYGFDDYVSRVEEHENNRFTGKSTSPIFDKDKALIELVRKNEADYEGSIGVGDSASDIKMLSLVETPIAFNPEKEFFEYAKSRGWKVVIGRWKVENR